MDSTIACTDINCWRYTDIAALKGHLGCLKYAHQNGCKWHRETIASAAVWGNLECLRYVHKNGCKWDSYATWGAARNGHLECLKYVYENCGDVATWETADLEKDFEYFSKEIRDYIDSVREEWKCGLNRSGMRTKSAKRNWYRMYQKIFYINTHSHGNVWTYSCLVRQELHKNDI